MSEQEYEGLTLEELAQRLEALEGKNERMCSEHAELQHKVASLEGSGTSGAEEPAAEFYGPASLGEREDKGRTLEGLAQRLDELERENASLRSEAALAGVPTSRGEAALRDNREASNVEFGEVRCKTVDASEVTVRGRRTFDTIGIVYGRCEGPGAGVEGSNGEYGKPSVHAAVRGDSRASNGIGVYGEGATYGVQGRGDDPIYGLEGTGVRGEGATGVWGSSSKIGWSGVYGQHTAEAGSGNSAEAGYGVVGDGTGSGAGVFGRNSSGTAAGRSCGVLGEGQFGIIGKSTAPGFAGVSGEHTGQQGYGVLGRNDIFTGVRALGKTGVWGSSLGGGYGGQFDGGKAQLMLKPKGGTPGKPTSGEHTKGELFMDSEAALFVCTASGTPGTWRRFTTTAA